MAELISLRDAVEDLVKDGDAVALEGFTHLIPFAAGHELLRQGRRELELIRMTSDVLYDQMIGMGVARKLVFSYGGNPGVGSLHRFRDAIEHEWPRPIELEEHSHAGMANRFAAGAARLPFAVLRGYLGTDLMTRTRVEPIACPFHGRTIGGGASSVPRRIDHPRPRGRPQGQRPALGDPPRPTGSHRRDGRFHQTPAARAPDPTPPVPAPVLAPRRGRG